MDSAALFEMRRSLVNAGISDENAEQIVIALDNGMASRMDEVMSKWEAKLDARFQAIDARFQAIDGRFTLLERDMTIRLGLMLVAAIGIFATLAKLL